jgi:protein-L-isoaspartate(D-aspartate) O-methyltransferase
VLVADVYSIEIVKALSERAAERLESMGYVNVHLRVGDGYNGWPE